MTKAVLVLVPHLYVFSKRCPLQKFAPTQYLWAVLVAPLGFGITVGSTQGAGIVYNTNGCTVTSYKKHSNGFSPQILAPKKGAADQHEAPLTSSTAVGL